MNPERREKLVDFIRIRSADLPWPEIDKKLQEQGYAAGEIAEGIDEAFPGTPAKNKNRAAVRAGLIGAIVAIVVWLVLALIYRAGGPR